MDRPSSAVLFDMAQGLKVLQKWLDMMRGHLHQRIREVARLKHENARLTKRVAELERAQAAACVHAQIVADTYYPDGSVDGSCTSCSARGFPIRDVAHERFRAGEVGDPAVDDRLGYGPRVEVHVFEVRPR